MRVQGTYLGSRSIQAANLDKPSLEKLISMTPVAIFTLQHENPKEMYTVIQGSDDLPNGTEVTPDQLKTWFDQHPTYCSVYMQHEQKQIFRIYELGGQEK